MWCSHFIPLQLCFIFRDFCSYVMNLGICFSITTKTVIVILCGSYTLLWVVWTFYILTVISLAHAHSTVFNFFHQCFTIFSEQIFHLFSKFISKFVFGFYHKRDYFLVSFQLCHHLWVERLLLFVMYPATVWNSSSRSNGLFMESLEFTKRVHIICKYRSLFPFSDLDVFYYFLVASQFLSCLFPPKILFGYLDAYFPVLPTHSCYQIYKEFMTVILHKRLKLWVLLLAYLFYCSLHGFLHPCFTKHNFKIF